MLATLPVAVLAKPGETVNLQKILEDNYGPTLGGFSEVLLSYDSSRDLKSFDFSYWKLSSPSVNRWIVTGDDIGGGWNNQTQVTAGRFDAVKLKAGNAISANAVLGGSTGDNYSFFTVAVIDPRLADSDFGRGNVDPGDVVAAAKRFADFYGSVPNTNDCHNIASEVAAAAGASFGTWETGSRDPRDNTEYGFWRIAYRGSDSGTVSNWSKLVKAGDIVRMGWDIGGEHTTTVLKNHSDGRLTVYDNFGNTIGIKTVSWDAATSPKTITIYRLSKDDLFLVNGTSGSDRIPGTRFDDKFIGKGGSDTLTGWAGDDLLDGGSGKDFLDGGAGADRMKGGSGDDTFQVQNSRDRAYEKSGEGTDLVNSSVSFSLAGQHIEKLDLTGSKNINAAGNALKNTLWGNSGDNKLDGGKAGDRMYGGDGKDTYIVQSSGDRAYENEGGGNDRVNSSVSYILGGQHIEVLDLTGSANINATGNASKNTIYGNGGANVLNGRGGNDLLNGGQGRDHFVFDSKLDASTNVDFIISFVVADDTIQLDSTVFSDLQGIGTLTTEQFHKSTDGMAHDADDRIIYNSATGEICYDNNGDLVGGAEVFAKVAKNLALDSADFFVI